MRAKREQPCLTLQEAFDRLLPHYEDPWEALKRITDAFQGNRGNRLRLYCCSVAADPLNMKPVSPSYIKTELKFDLAQGADGRLAVVVSPTMRAWDANASYRWYVDAKGLASLMPKSKGSIDQDNIRTVTRDLFANPEIMPFGVMFKEVSAEMKRRGMREPGRDTCLRVWGRRKG